MNAEWQEGSVKLRFSVPGFGCPDCSCRFHLLRLRPGDIIGSFGLKIYQDC